MMGAFGAYLVLQIFRLAIAVTDHRAGSVASSGHIERTMLQWLYN